MKKISLLMVMVLALLSMASCVPSNSPKGVAKQALEAMKEKDFDKIVNLMGNNQGEELSANQKSQLNLLANNKINNSDDITSYKILDEEINADGKNAVVRYTVTYAGKPSEDGKINLVKGPDGVWRIPMSK